MSLWQYTGGGIIQAGAGDFNFKSEKSFSYLGYQLIGSIIYPTQIPVFNLSLTTALRISFERLIEVGL